MLVTIVCSIMLMTGLFLMLLGGVGFIQNKSFTSTERCTGRLEDKKKFP